MSVASLLLLFYKDLRLILKSYTPLFCKYEPAVFIGALLSFPKFPALGEGHIGFKGVDGSNTRGHLPGAAAARQHYARLRLSF